MNLDNRVNYLTERKLLDRMPVASLQKLVGELHDIRYIDNDIEVDAYHRLAASVLLDRTNKGQTLIYHLKNFLGLVLLVCKTLTIFKL